MRETPPHTAEQTRPRRNVRRVLVGLSAVAVIAAFVPGPVKQLPENMPVWEATAQLRATAPLYEHQDRGSSYSPLALVLIDTLAGTSLGGHPSGSTRVREFELESPEAGRAATSEAVAAGSSTGYAMQSLTQIGEHWQADGWDATGKMRYVVTWDGNTRVHLLVEHVY